MGDASSHRRDNVTMLQGQGLHRSSLSFWRVGIGLALAAAAFVMSAVIAQPENNTTLTVDSSQAITRAIKEDRDGIATAGGTFLLAPGRYDTLVINGLSPARNLTLKAQDRHAASFPQIKLLNARNVSIEGIAVIADTKLTEDQAQHLTARLFEINGSQKVLVEDVYVSSAQDTSGWSVTDWLQRVRSGIFIRGSSQVTVRNSTFENVFDAITDYHNSHTLIENNMVRNFAGDGIRAIGDHAIIKGNTISDCIKINDNHDDGIQSWSYGPDGSPGQGELVGLRILNNTIVQSTGPHPLRCDHMHGVGFFDGFWRDLVIEGNTVMIDHWHGISVYGARDAVVRGNVVLYRKSHAKKHKFEGRKNSWIKVGPHKDGRPSQRVLIEDNKAATFDIEGEDIVMRRNTRLNEDLRGKANSGDDDR